MHFTFIIAPTNKDDLLRFLCMMQNNSSFVANFAQKAVSLRELTGKFYWILLTILSYQ